MLSDLEIIVKQRLNTRATRVSLYSVSYASSRAARPPVFRLSSRKLSRIPIWNEFLPLREITGRALCTHFCSPRSPRPASNISLRAFGTAQHSRSADHPDCGIDPRRTPVSGHSRNKEGWINDERESHSDRHQPAVCFRTATGRPLYSRAIRLGGGILNALIQFVDGLFLG